MEYKGSLLCSEEPTISPYHEPDECSSLSHYFARYILIWLLYFPLNSGFAGSNPGERDGFLRAIKIRSTTSFRGEVKPSATCFKILRHTKDPLRYDSDTDKLNVEAISCEVSPPSLLGVFVATSAMNSGG
jgi:hypothetical protein